MVTRVPYNHNEGKINVTSELENLRRHYAELQHKKQELKGKAMKRAIHGKVSETQIRLYKEGVHKISTLKIREEEQLEKAIDRGGTVHSRNPSPSPVCDRLYEQGMLHKKDREERTQPPSPCSSRRKVTSSPVCDRLYIDGLAKIKARRSSSTQKNDMNSSSDRKHTPLSRRRSNSIDRLYQQGVEKIRSRSKTRNPVERKSIRSISPNATCDRLYEQGKAKLRSHSKPRLPPSSATHIRGRTPTVKSCKKQSSDDSSIQSISNIKVRHQSPVPTQRLPGDDVCCDDGAPSLE